MDFSPNGGVFALCTHDTEFVLLHKLDEDELGRCRAATQRRRSDACPAGPCVCRNLGRRPRVPRKVLRSFSDAAVVRQASTAGSTGAHERS